MVNILPKLTGISFYRSHTFLLRQAFEIIFFGGSSACHLQFTASKELVKTVILQGNHRNSYPDFQNKPNGEFTEVLFHMDSKVGAFAFLWKICFTSNMIFALDQFGAMPGPLLRKYWISNGATV